MNQYDVIVIGSDINGLVTSAMIAKSGKKVLVIDEREQIGGLTAMQKFSSGSMVNPVYDAIQWIDPRVIKDLELNNYDLEIDNPKTLRIALDKYGKHIKFYSDNELTSNSISNYSLEDAKKWPDFCSHINNMSNFLESIYQLTPPKLPNINLKDALSMRSMLSPLRKHGTKGLTDFIKIAPMMMPEIMDEWFETELLRAAISTSGIRHLSQGPFAAATGYNFLHQHVYANGIINNSILIKGGTSAFVKCVEKVAKSHGVQIINKCQINSIDLNKGVCSGVTINSDEKIISEYVVSSLDPSATFENFVGTKNLNPAFLTQLQNIKYRGSVTRIHLELNELPEINGVSNDEMNTFFSISPSIEYLERASDACKYGEVSKNPFLEFSFPTINNPELSSNGKQILSATIQYTPYHLRNNKWSDSLKNELKNNIISILEKYIPRITSLIDSSLVVSPFDFEQRFGIKEGSFNHGEMTLDQFFFMRPTISSAQYKSPIPNLFICGSSTHPGGGIHGANGYNAAKEILKS